jgi:hypothetical protein
MNFFRFQYGHYTLGEMQNYNSEDGGDGGEDGLCACDSVSDLMRNTVWTESDAGEAEVVVLRGQAIEEIYDGTRIYPTEVLATFKPTEFAKNAQQIAEQYEEW